MSKVSFGKSFVCGCNLLHVMHFKPDQLESKIKIFSIAKYLHIHINYAKKADSGDMPVSKLTN